MPDATWAALASTAPLEDLERALLRHQTLEMRDRVALAATRGRLRYPELLADARRRGRRAPRWDMGMLAALARMVATQSLTPTDRIDAIELYRLAGRGRRLEERHTLTLVELLVSVGDKDAARALMSRHDPLPPAFDLLRLDADSPFTDGPGRALRWTEGFAALWARHGLEAPALGDGPGEPFDRLVCSPARTCASGPLVTVVMTTYNPTERLLHSLRSIVNQSWTNLDILLVDDASEPSHRDVLEAARALDDRVRCLELPTNQGTYLARNAGMAAAWGTIVTGQDDDDWSHPRRIERQIAPLLRDPSLPATWSRMIRTTERLRFHDVGFQPARVAPITLMFRRDVTLALGGFAPARRSADSELIERIAARTGREPLRLREPLLLARVREESLSSGDFRAGWHHPARVAIRSSWRAWHSDVRAGGDPVPGRSARTLRIPARYRIERPTATEHVDLLLVGDWRRDDGVARTAVDVARHAGARGRRVALLQLDSPWLVEPRNRDICRPVADLVNEGIPLAIMDDDDVRAHHVVVLEPLVLDSISGSARGPAAEHVTIVATRPARLADGALVYDVGACLATAERLFGAPARWSAALHGSASDLSAVSLAPWLLSPVIGHGLGQDGGQGPSAAPIGPLVVRGVVDPADLVAERLQLPQPPVDPSGHGPPTVWIPGVARPTFAAVREGLEAMAKGLVVVAPESFRHDLPDGARYAAEADLVRVAEHIAAGGPFTPRPVVPAVEGSGWDALLDDCGSAHPGSGSEGTT